MTTKRKIIAIPKRNMKGRISLLLLTLVLTGLLAILLKQLYQVPRVCEGVAGCPEDYAYPSGHTSVGFALVFPLLGTQLFWPAYLLATFMAIWRVELGVHNWFEIGGGLATAGLAYALVEGYVIRKEKQVIHHDDERPRQTIHILVGVILSLFFFYDYGLSYLILLLGGWLGLMILNLKLLGYPIPIIDYLLNRFERKGSLPGEGSLYYVLGVLFASGLLQNNVYGIISILITLSLGDGLATVLGKHYGKHRLPWNPNKTWEGSLGYLIGSLPVLLLLNMNIGIPFILILTLIESLPLRIDDNILLPIIGSSFLYFV